VLFVFLALFLSCSSVCALCCLRCCRAIRRGRQQNRKREKAIDELLRERATRVSVAATPVAKLTVSDVMVKQGEERAGLLSSV
jgi:hypothetical protein